MLARTLSLSSLPFLSLILTEPVDVGQLLRMIVVPVAACGVHNEIVGEYRQRRGGSVSRAGCRHGRRRPGKLSPPPNSDAGHVHLRDGSDSVLKVGCNLLEEEEGEEAKEREREKC